MTEQCFCQSVVNNDGVIENCTCGKCETKNCMFQYATRQKIIENTGLITRQEADGLLEKYKQDLIERWNDFESPQMCIWVDCDSETSYHTMAVEIDYLDCVLKNGHIYRVKEERVL